MLRAKLDALSASVSGSCARLGRVARGGLRVASGLARGSKGDQLLGPRRAELSGWDKKLGARSDRDGVRRFFIELRERTLQSAL